MKLQNNVLAPTDLQEREHGVQVLEDLVHHLDGDEGKGPADSHQDHLRPQGLHVDAGRWGDTQIHRYTIHIYGTRMWDHENV